MSKEKYKNICISALQNSQGDNYARAKHAFGGLSDYEMQQRYGQSGCTRQEILDGHKEHYDQIQVVIDWVKSL